MHAHRSRWITALAVSFAVALAETPLLAQGVSPWLNAVDVLQQAFTGPLARGLSLIAIVNRRADVRLRGRRQQEGARGDHLRLGHGDGRRELPDNGCSHDRRRRAPLARVSRAVGPPSP